MAFGYVYKITNLANGKMYIGQTTSSIEKRWKEHLCTYPTRKYLLHKAIAKYGKENFKIEILAEAHFPEMMDDIERFYIKQFNSIKPNGYNLESGGNKHKTLHADIKAKIKDSNTGFKCKQPNSRRVTCMDMETGVEWSYPNMGSAEKDGFCRQSIFQACAGKQLQHKNKRWKYAEETDYPTPKLKRISRLEQLLDTPVRAISNERSFEFRSIKEAHENGFDRSNIARCINGKQKQYKGLKWSRA